MGLKYLVTYLVLKDVAQRASSRACYSTASLGRDWPNLVWPIALIPTFCDRSASSRASFMSLFTFSLAS